MRPYRPPRAGITLSLIISAICLTNSAYADDVACTDLPNPVFGIGGSAQKPTVGDFAVAFRNAADEITLIYQSPGACFAMPALIDGTPITGTSVYWEADGTERTCTLPLAGVAADFGVMGNVPTTCPGVDGIPESVGQFDGAVLGWNVIVPAGSTQQSISSEALYFVYGFGPEGGVAPWTDAAQINSRSSTSAAGIAIASAANLPVERLYPNDVRTNGAMVTNLAASTNPEAGIGFVSGDVADRSRTQVRTLAYQHSGQECAYWPDSSATSFDKAGIRWGQYWLWTATFFYAPVDPSGRPRNAGAARFIDFATGTSAPTDEIPAFELLVEGGNIPRCAMHVTRNGDYTPLLPYEPAAPCDCAFESVATGTTDCTPCTDNAQCGNDAPICRFGFCEVR